MGKFCFEPEPTNYALLKQNILNNGYKNVILINKAVSDKMQGLSYFGEDNLGDHRIYDS